MTLFSDSALPFPQGMGPRTRQWFRPMFDAVTRLGELDQLYATAAHLQGAAFIESILAQLNVRVEYDPAELARLPRHGAFIGVANHPSGMLDGLVLLHILLRHRPDLRVVASERLDPLAAVLGNNMVLVDAETTIPVRNTPRLRHLLGHLHNDVPLLLFPSGQVAHAHHPFSGVTDPAWHPTAGRLLTVAPVPVVPIWLSGQNSAIFNWLGLIHPLLRTALLPTELLNKRGQTVRVRLGHPIPAAEIHRLPADARLGYLRARVYALGAPLIEKGSSAPQMVPVADETAARLIEIELAQLRPGRLLVRSGHWEVYVARAAEIPFVLREIGRLRELTFRQVGEGTGHGIDLDAYDGYYRHLFLYDREARCLVGGYRLGPGRSILRRYGKKGLYLHSLFRLQAGIRPLLEESVELGRSWIRTEYQRQPLPLALLWKGIATWLSAHPDYRFLIGPVSISNHFSAMSKALLVRYLEQHYFDHTLAQYVIPRKRFRYRPLPGEPADTTVPSLECGLDSLEALNRLIADIEPGGLGMPVLLRQYLRQNGRLIGFNLDPAFSNALDGFLVLNAQHLPERTRKLLERY